MRNTKKYNWKYKQNTNEIQLELQKNTIGNTKK